MCSLFLHVSDLSSSCDWFPISHVLQQLGLLGHELLPVLQTYQLNRPNE